MSAPLPDRALVIGGGTMGTGIAASLCAAGIDTVLQIRRPSALHATRQEVARRIEQLTRQGLAVASRPNVSVEAARPQGPFALAIESVPEDPDIKRAVLAETEAILGDGGVLASNTSSLALSTLATPLSRPERFVGWHWFNPAELVKLVEIVATPQTAPEVVHQLIALSHALHKQPVTLRREIPGFIANRLQYALLREAYALVEAGICGPQDVDHAVVAGLGARWAAIGPFTSMDAAGLDVHETVAARLFPDLSCASAVPTLLRQLRNEGALGMKNGRGLLGDYAAGSAAQVAARRDAMLMLLARQASET